jgi:hypothetical protein
MMRSTRTPIWLSENLQHELHHPGRSAIGLIELSKNVSTRSEAGWLRSMLVRSETKQYLDDRQAF